MKSKENDIYDYELRGKKQVFYQIFLNPPKMNVSYGSHAPITNVFDDAASTKNIYNKAIVTLDMAYLNLFPNQLERLLFLLGPRYKNDFKLKLVISHTESLTTNIGIALDIIKQIYLEALRAPLIPKNRTEFENRLMCINLGGIDGLEFFQDYANFIEDTTTQTYNDYLKYFYTRLSDLKITPEDKNDLYMEIEDYHKEKRSNKNYEMYKFFKDGQNISQFLSQIYSKNNDETVATLESKIVNIFSNEYVDNAEKLKKIDVPSKHERIQNEKEELGLSKSAEKMFANKLDAFS